MTSNDELLHGLVMMAPVVTVGATRTPLVAAAQARLIRVVVDTHLHLPDMFELAFYDDDCTVLTDGGLALGTELSIAGKVKDEQAQPVLVVGEITSIEGHYDTLSTVTLVRGYSHDHRLQRTRRTRTFLNAKDSDVASQVAGQAGLTVGQVTATAQSHPHLAQRDQSDWQFLTERAAEIGYEVGVLDGKFFFRPARATSGTAAGAAVSVTLGEQLQRFRPRVSAANLAPEVEVRTWDPTEAKVIAATKPTATTAVDVGAGAAAAAADTFAGRPAPPAVSGAGSQVGPAPSTKAYVVVDRGLSVAASSDQAVLATAEALAEHVASSFAEADGEIFGDARVVAGTVLTIDGVPTQFAGGWVVTRARHVFDSSEFGYRTHFEVSGRHDRSLLALTSGGPLAGHRNRVDGVVCGVVTDVNDPLDLGRVKVMLPWLSPDYETDWAPTAQLLAGANGGALFVPGPEEQVLVAFEFGDLRRPYVLGSLVNNRTGAGCRLDGSTGSAKPGATAVKAVGKQASVIRSGFVSPTGSRIVLHDEAPPSGGQPTAAEVIVGTGQDKLALLMDAVAGTLTLRCNPDKPGKLVIECGGSTAVEITAGPSGTMTIDGGQQLNLKGKLVQLEATGVLTVKGQTIKLN